MYKTYNITISIYSGSTYGVEVFNILYANREEAEEGT